MIVPSNETSWRCQLAFWIAIEKNGVQEWRVTMLDFGKKFRISHFFTWQMACIG
jgi:hypothetical protein